MGSIGIPIKLLNEAQGHVCTLELTSGQIFRGKLIEAEDNMNVQLKDITVTARDGRVSHLDQVYIRGSHVRFFIVPDMLRFVYTPPTDKAEEIGNLRTHQCSAPELLEDVVLDWQEEELRLFVPEDNREAEVKEDSQIVKFNRS
ncbi:uncharacterized protein H6S33_011252 [Morchella sextelata]|uniref:uncharacterized protein n=1 Tax=Morchella sextelata TaxID=1174677 RepID=UPI001D052DFC|nr:uncharacterized protein H6S33_011252 [Morchella sextelata]KAH0610825.1 hypothetical protein H6S33_011252 [Morchella sextelata]